MFPADLTFPTIYVEFDGFPGSLVARRRALIRMWEDARRVPGIFRNCSLGKRLNFVAELQFEQRSSFLVDEMRL